MPGKTLIRRKLFHAAVGLLVVACGGGGGGGDPIGPPAANIVGHYTVTHTGTIPGLNPIECPGELDITSQNGNSFSGTITLIALQDCPPGFAGTGTLQGTVSNTGAISFSMTLATVEAALDMAGCEIVGGDPDFTGSAGTAGIVATRTLRLRCEAQGGPFETDFEYMVAGPKT